MTRLLAGIDRIATMLVGLALIAIALLTISWRYDWWPHLKTTSNTAALTQTFGHDWWPWALTGAGIMLLLLGIRWLYAHLVPHSVANLNLPDSGGPGRSELQAKAAAQAAADALAETPGIRSARGTIKRDRGQLVLDVRATIEPTADLRVIAVAGDQVSAELVRVTSRPDLHMRVNLAISSKAPTPTPRVV